MKVKTVNISLPEQLLSEIDQKAREEYRSRSELIKEAAVFYIRTKSNWAILQSDIVTKDRKLDISSEDDIEKMVDSERL